MIVVDSHCDTPSQVVRLRDLQHRSRLGQVDFPKLKEGGVDACFFALYTPQSMDQDYAIEYVCKMIDMTKASVDACDYVAMAGSVDNIMQNKYKHLVSILFGLENGMSIGQSLERLDLLYEKGVRYVTLTHNGDNQIADSASEGSTWGGLSPFGEDVVSRMNELGMLIDVAHASDKTFYDCLNVSSTPIVSTHSCCRALASHRRNMDDNMLKALADKGGVIQINFYPVFLSDDFSKYFSSNPISLEADIVEGEFIAAPSDESRKSAWEKMQDKLLSINRPSYKLVADHIEHAVNKAGIESVGIGSDFDGITVTPEGLEDISKIHVVFDELSSRGYSDDEIEKIAGKNFLRVLSDAEKHRSIKEIPITIML